MGSNNLCQASTKNRFYATQGFSSESSPESKFKLWKGFRFEPLRPPNVFLEFQRSETDAVDQKIIITLVLCNLEGFETLSRILS